MVFEAFKCVRWREKYDKCIEFGTKDFLYLCVLHAKAHNLVPDLIYEKYWWSGWVSMETIHFTFLITNLTYRSSILGILALIILLACLQILLIAIYVLSPINIINQPRHQAEGFPIKWQPWLCAVNYRRTMFWRVCLWISKNLLQEFNAVILVT